MSQQRECFNWVRSLCERIFYYLEVKMNTELFQQFDTAYKYLLFEETAFTCKIRELRGEMQKLHEDEIRAIPPCTPSDMLKKQKLADDALLLVAWPVGLLNRKKRKEEEAETRRKLNEQYVSEMQRHEQYIEKLHAKRNEIQNRIDSLNAQNKEFYHQYGSCLSFITDENLKNLRAISSMRYKVKIGAADTWKEALNAYFDDLKEERMIAMQKEFMSEISDREKETQSILRDINSAIDETNRSISQNTSALVNIYDKLFRANRF